MHWRMAAISVAWRDTKIICRPENSQLFSLPCASSRLPMKRISYLFHLDGQRHGIGEAAVIGHDDIGRLHFLHDLRVMKAQGEDGVKQKPKMMRARV